MSCHGSVMKSGDMLKQRIIGLLVLASLVVIILPVLFDFDGQYRVDPRSQIPERPDITPVPIADQAPEPEPQANMAEDALFGIDAARAAIEQAGGQQPEDLEPEAPELTSGGVPVSWLLQIASFGEDQKARAMLEKLINDGYRAYSEASTVNGKTIHRVYVGPKFLKQDLLEDKAVIDKKYGLETLLLRLEP